MENTNILINRWVENVRICIYLPLLNIFYIQSINTDKGVHFGGFILPKNIPVSVGYHDEIYDQTYVGICKQFIPNMNFNEMTSLNNAVLFHVMFIIRLT